MKICDENIKPNALLCTEVDPIHCVFTSQTKYSEPLNPVFYYPSIATKILSSMIIAIIPTFSIRFINNLLLLPKDDLMTRGRGGLDTPQKWWVIYEQPLSGRRIRHYLVLGDTSLTYYLEIFGTSWRTSSFTSIISRITTYYYYLMYK